MRKFIVILGAMGLSACAAAPDLTPTASLASPSQTWVCGYQTAQHDIAKKPFDKGWCVGVNKALQDEISGFRK